MFILTNDDGIDAPGLRALATAVSTSRVVVAPVAHLSGCSHQVTTTSPIQVQRRAAGEWAIAGTPADCVRVALAHLQGDLPPIQYVLSGINEGGNLGADIHISGTVAAVREAALHGIPGIAVSHYRQGKRAIDWEVASHLTRKVLTVLLNRPLEPGSFWNVNLPHPQPGDPEPDLIFCSPCKLPLPVKFRVEGEQLYYAGEYAKRPRSPGSDVDICFSGNIAISQISL